MHRLCRYVAESRFASMSFAVAFGLTVISLSGTLVAQEFVQTQLGSGSTFIYEHSDQIEFLGAEQGFTGCESCDDCGSCDCCGSLSGLCRRLRDARRQRSWFSCSCNGSYKFPVPPLYTYHWPGLYQLERMTDYHSPWRFPPLKPYAPEPPLDDQVFLPSVVPTGAVEAFASTDAGGKLRRAGGRHLRPEPTSAKIRRAYRIAR